MTFLIMFGCIVTVIMVGGIYDDISEANRVAKDKEKMIKAQNEIRKLRSRGAVQ